MSDGMVKFGDAWLRASQIESIRPYDVYGTPEHRYGIEVHMISGKSWAHQTWTAPSGFSSEKKAAQEGAKAERGNYVGDLLERVSRGMR